MAATTTLDVEMNCSGCSGACSRILNKLDGVVSFETDLETQKIVVQHDASTVTSEGVLAAIKKWGDAGGKSVKLASVA